MQEREIFYRRHPDPMWVHDHETLYFLHVNDAAVSAYGYSREEFLAMQVTALCRAQGGPGLADPSSRAVPGGPGPGTALLVKKTGDIVIGEITVHAIDWHGRRAEMVSVRDATRTLQLEREREAVLAREAGLRRAAEAAAIQFERLFSAVPGNMLVLEPGTWTVLAVSDALLESARATRQDILGRALFDAFPDAGEKPYAASMRQMRASLDVVLGTGQPNQPPILYYPVPANDPSSPGAEHRLWLAVNTPVKSAEGAISYVMCTLEDVTAIVTGRSARGTSFEVIDRARKTFHRQDLPYLRTTLDLRSALAMLAEQNVSLRTAQRLIRIGIWKYEIWSGRLILSPDMQEIYGLPDTGFEETFESYTGLVHPDDKAAMIRNYEDFKASGASLLEFAHRIVRPDGRVVHVRGTGEVAQTPEGYLLTGVVQDISQEIEQGSRLALLDQSVRRLNDVVIIFEAIDGPRGLEVPIVYVNPAFLRITGLDRTDVLGQPVSKVMVQTVPGVPFEVLSAALSHPVSMRSDIQLHSRDGRIVPAEIDLVPVTGQDAQLTHWIAVIRDMSEKFAADERARANEERYQLLSRSTHDVVWDWDFVNRKVTWNENFRQIAGDPAAPLVAAPASWIDRLHADDRERVLEGFFGAAAGDMETWSDEYRFRRDDGDIRYVFDRGFITRDASGKALHIIGSMVDITAQKQAEARLAQSEKLEALGQITGGVAHDFNNLLMIILGNAETLLDRAVDPRERRLLELVFSAAERGRDLTGRLLAFARRIPLKPVQLDINEQASRCAELLRRTFRSNIRIETDLGAPEVNIACDPAQLELVLLNLAVNARDSMPEGGALTLETRLAAHNGAAQVTLTIADTGAGMDSETLRRCLEPFFTTKPVGEGVGLGLSMAFGFMEQTGGKLQITSEPGKGTRVSLVFPQAEQSGSAGLPILPEALVGGDELVLLIEDEPGVREHVRGVLAGLGYRVAACETADAAIGYLKAGGRADLILSDLVMPGSTDVRDVVRLARETDPDIPVLYSSGYPKEMIRLDGRLAPDIDLLPKPYRRAELAKRLRDLLDRSRAGKGPNAAAGDQTGEG